MLSQCFAKAFHLVIDSRLEVKASIYEISSVFRYSILVNPHMTPGRSRVEKALGTRLAVMIQFLFTPLHPTRLTLAVPLSTRGMYKKVLVNGMLRGTLR